MNQHENDKGEVTVLLEKAGEGDADAIDNLYRLVRSTLRSLAKRKLANESPDHSLGTLDLVNDAFMKTALNGHYNWDSREQFYAFAAKAMNWLLIDHARKKNAAQRGGRAWNRVLVELKDERLPFEDVLAVRDAVEQLYANKDEREGAIVIFRFFFGLKLREIAPILGISLSQVKRDWDHAKAWLSRELKK